jgi:hypothetical protein
LQGLAFFRVKQIDNNGSYSYSPIVKLQNGLAVTSEIIVIPTVFKDGFTINANKAVNAVLLNATGQVVKVLQLRQGANYIDAYNLSSGVYFIKVNGGEINKIVKQ